MSVNMIAASIRCPWDKLCYAGSKLACDKSLVGGSSWLIAAVRDANLAQKLMKIRDWHHGGVTVFYLPQ